jgi:hypothetical protein
MWVHTHLLFGYSTHEMCKKGVVINQIKTCEGKDIVDRTDSRYNVVARKVKLVWIICICNALGLCRHDSGRVQPVNSKYINIKAKAIFQRRLAP